MVAGGFAMDSVHRSQGKESVQRLQPLTEGHRDQVISGVLQPEMSKRIQAVRFLSIRKRSALHTSKYTVPPSSSIAWIKSSPFIYAREAFETTPVQVGVSQAWLPLSYPFASRWTRLARDGLH